MWLKLLMVWILFFILPVVVFIVMYAPSVINEKSCSPDWLKFCLQEIIYMPVTHQPHITNKLDMTLPKRTKNKKTLDSPYCEFIRILVQCTRLSRLQSSLFYFFCHSIVSFIRFMSLNVPLVSFTMYFV